MATELQKLFTPSRSVENKRRRLLISFNNGLRRLLDNSNTMAHRIGDQYTYPGIIADLQHVAKRRLSEYLEL